MGQHRTLLFRLALLQARLSVIEQLQCTVDVRQQRVAAAGHAFVGCHVPALRVQLPLNRISILSPCVSCSCATTCHGVSKYREGENFAFVNRVRLT